MRVVYARAVAAILMLCAAASAQPSPELTREFQAGVDAFRLGKLAEARAHLEKAKALDPKLPGPNRFLAAVAQGQQRWQDCIDLARTAIQQNPRSAEIAATKKVHDECRVSAGRTPYRQDLGESAAIAVSTSVAGATVKIGGLGYGGTPLAPRPITAGTLEVEIEKPGWKPVRVSVDALAGLVTDVIVELEPDPNAQNPDVLVAKPAAKKTTGSLVVGDLPALTVDGQVMTPQNGRVELAPGTHVIEIDRAAHDPWRRRVRINAGQATPIAPHFVETAAREKKETIGIALVSGGAAVTVFGFVAMLRSGDASAEAREIDRLETSRPPAGQYTRADFEAARDRAHKWSRISNVAYGAGLAVIGAGALYLYLGGSDRGDVAPPFAVTPVAGGAVVSREASW